MQSGQLMQANGLVHQQGTRWCPAVEVHLKKQQLLSCHDQPCMTLTQLGA